MIYKNIHALLILNNVFFLNYLHAHLVICMHKRIREFWYNGCVHFARARQVLCKLLPRPHMRFLACTTAHSKSIMTNRKKGQKLVSFERLRELDSH
jgi:hypothetical protein